MKRALPEPLEGDSTAPSSGKSGSKAAADPSTRRAKKARVKFKKWKASKVCFDFRRDGSCKFGDACKYVHHDSVVEEATTESKNMIRKQAEQRLTPMQRMKAGASAKVAGDPQVRPSFGSMAERYYTRLFCTDFAGRERHDQYVFIHSNKVSVVGLAPSHPAVSGGSPIVSLDFSHKNKRGVVSRDFSKLVTSGKKKKGGGVVQEDTTLCLLTTADGTVYKIGAYVPRRELGASYSHRCARRSCLPGHVIEVNQRVIADPSLIQSKGYIALVLPNQHKVASIQRSLKTLSEYNALRGGAQAAAATSTAADAAGAGAGAGSGAAASAGGSAAAGAGAGADDAAAAPGPVAPVPAAEAASAASADAAPMAAPVTAPASTAGAAPAPAAVDGDGDAVMAASGTQAGDDHAAAAAP